MGTALWRNPEKALLLAWGLGTSGCSVKCLIYIAVEIGQGFKQMSPAQEGITKGKGIPPGA
jgi:hypothetical protein